ncbi:ribosome biogenesis GTP-binding protein YihA/YsxC [Hathewaya histolytica]|uniref:Probable GTP-binding protein EngB n=1 Tax=Hathewaya histolytica TaxID=1498 RepID=A0A4U9R3W2_HATHI|nr:ribosome biogenesis GTP-binding protein YihA/YsxC [Hathewaya histolytica]VTQ85935.1 GTP-binding protein EngB [Hathewaya histolytica]
MRIKQSDFICSAVTPNQYPEDKVFEVAFVGRSNVGKSSLINTLTNRRKLVKVSGVPGKTRLINFFLINNKYNFVDLPGYGYAKVSKTEKAKWGKIMEEYLVNRENLEKIILLLDSRHKPTADDVLMYEWINHYNIEPVIVATKIDKLKRSEINKNLKVIRDTLNLSKDQKIFQFSSLKKSGIEELLEEIFNGVEEEE